jgi:hypothetical protein
MRRIATDLDETLFDMMTPFKKILMKRHSARVVDEATYNITTYPEISEDDIWDKRVTWSGSIEYLVIHR